jgi:hypothetical protein
MVDRCYDAFNKMLDGLVLACNKRLEQAKERKQNAVAPVELRDNQAA